ncbi:hydroxyethylthiazole kinase [Sphingobacterium sp. LRF_L2]|uniref:hydroxyethylthiazole kinase n=1 Tax=Sphingobacterium sp. LRF_L2 TaxID=3369421 RepID=UPI003F62B834
MELDIILQKLSAVRAATPLVHNITNFVVMNNTANALLAIGASPVMAHGQEEIKEVLSISQALVVNIGTLNRSWANAMITAAAYANEINCPWLLDPVGAGISAFRNSVLAELLSLHPAVIRGNASEIIALHNASDSSTKGVDSTTTSDNAFEAGRALQQMYGSVVCISGAKDYIIGKRGWTEVDNGSPLMTRVTGLGCSASAIVGAFLGLRQDHYQEAVAGISLFSLAGELAAAKASGPGSLQLKLYDTLYALSEEDIKTHLNIQEHAF